MSDIERIWRCDCGAGEFITVNLIDFDDDLQPWLSVESYIDYDTPWQRVKGAWGVLWKGRSHTAEVLLTSRQVEEIRDCLIEVQRRLQP